MAGESPLGLVLKLLEQRRENPLGHSPDDPILQLVRLNLAALPGNLEADRVMRINPQEPIENDPMGGCDLRIRSNRGTRAQDEEVRPDGDRREDRGSGYHIVQRPREVFKAQLDADFLAGLSHCCGQQIRVAVGAPSAGQRDMTRPGIAGSLGPANEEDGIWIGDEKDCHCGPDQGGIIVRAGLEMSHPLAKVSEPAGQCVCDWQAPPQQPPGGGPRRL